MYNYDEVDTVAAIYHVLLDMPTEDALRQQYYMVRSSGGTAEARSCVIKLAVMLDKVYLKRADDIETWDLEWLPEMLYEAASVADDIGDNFLHLDQYTYEEIADNVPSY